MSGGCDLTSQAESDVAALAEFLARQNARVGVRFLDAVDRTVQRLAESPTLGAPCNFPRDPFTNLRVWHVDGFRNHLIYYRVIDDEVQVVRVLHAARDIGRIFGEG